MTILKPDGDSDVIFGTWPCSLTAQGGRSANGPRALSQRIRTYMYLPRHSQVIRRRFSK